MIHNGFPIFCSFPIHFGLSGFPFGAILVTMHILELFVPILLFRPELSSIRQVLSSTSHYSHNIIKLHDNEALQVT
jgi:hypothetical protein